MSSLVPYSEYDISNSDSQALVFGARILTNGDPGGRLEGLAVPYGRMGRPEDMVGAAVFLASADADYVVAQTLNVDGGNWMS